MNTNKKIIMKQKKSLNFKVLRDFLYQVSEKLQYIMNVK